MERESLPEFPPRIAALQEKLGRSLFRSLGRATIDLAEKYGSTYQEDFERRLQLLQRAFPEKPWPDWIAKGFIELNKAILSEELSFRRTGEYSAKAQDLDRVYDEVYDNENVMDGYYLVGLYGTYFLWPHHFRILQFYRSHFVEMGAPPKTVLEWGVGHGLLTLEALEHWNSTRASVVDISKFSLTFASRLFSAAGVIDRCDLVQGDVFELPPPQPVDRLICSELLEHVSNPELLLERARDALVPGGFGYLTGAINAAQPDHVYLFSSAQEILALVKKQGLIVQAHLTACHPNREGEHNPPAVVAIVVQRPP